MEDRGNSREQAPWKLDFCTLDLSFCTCDSGQVKQRPKFTLTVRNNTVVTKASKLLFMPGMWDMPVKTKTELLLT